MNFRFSSRSESEQIGSLFTSVFRDSEGDAEGALIGKLSKDLLETTEPNDLFVFIASDGDEITGSVIATRMPSEKENDIFLIAPVAVRTGHQGRGVGQNLILYGIRTMNEKGVKVLVTYGDPIFYSKVGFAPVKPELIEPPFRLSQPGGWLAQTSCGKKITTKLGKCRCVPAFDNPAYW